MTDKRGPYVARWWEGDVKRKRTFARKKDRDAFTAERRRRLALGDTPVPTPDVTLAQMTELYWTAYAVPQLAPLTRDSYAGIWDNHLRGQLGGYPLRRLTPLVVGQHVVNMRRTGATDTTIRAAMKVLSSILSLAVRLGLIPAEHGSPQPPYKPCYEPESAPPHASGGALHGVRAGPQKDPMPEAARAKPADGNGNPADPHRPAPIAHAISSKSGGVRVCRDIRAIGVSPPLPGGRAGMRRHAVHGRGGGAWPELRSLSHVASLRARHSVEVGHSRFARAAPRVRPPDLRP